LKEVTLSALCGDIRPQVKPPPDNFVTTHLQPVVFQAWVDADHDPDSSVPEWLACGAPAGLDLQPAYCGIFPRVEDEVATGADRDDLTLFDLTSPNEYVQPTLEAEELMYQEITTLEKKGSVASFTSAEQVQEFLQDKFVESKLFVLQQIKGTTVKNRVLLDCKRSKISATSSKPERVLLPRALDAITPCCSWHASTRGGRRTMMSSCHLQRTQTLRA